MFLTVKYKTGSMDFYENVKSVVKDEGESHSVVETISHRKSRSNYKDETRCKRVWLLSKDQNE